MERLSTELKGEQGPYILSDRRYRDSKVVHYRYGANADRGRIEANGATVPLIRDGAGRDGPDVRAPRFVLPAGIEDPFAEPAAPSGGPGYIRSTHCVEHGTAGVLHALRSSGVPIPDELIVCFRGDVMDADVALPRAFRPGTPVPPA